MNSNVSLAMKICRACLTVDEDCKFFEITDKRSYFTDFAKLSMDYSESHWLCSECNYIIGKAFTFRQRVLNADFMLKGLIGKFAAENVTIFEYLKTAQDVLSSGKLSRTKPLVTTYLNDSIADTEAALYDFPLDIDDFKLENAIQSSNDLNTLDIKTENVQIKLEDDDELADFQFFDDADDLPLLNMKNKLVRKLRGHKLRPKSKRRLKTKTSSKNPRYSDDDLLNGKGLEKRMKLALVAENNEKVVMLTLNKEEQIQALKEQATMKIYTEAVYKCELCVKGFRFEETFRAHLERHNENYGEYRCEICTQHMKTQNAYRNHMLNHSKRYKCTLCDYTRYSRSTVVEHYGAEHLKDTARMICNQCGKEFLKPSVMRKHIQYRHGEGDRSKPTCEHCGKTFTALETLRLHMLKHVTEQKPEGRKRYKCQTCGMCFRTPTLLRTHGIKHSDSRDFYCVECDLSFKSEFILKQHLKASKRHVDPSSLLQCPQCPMKALNQKLLDQHVEKMHLCVADHQCDMCERAFYTNTLLRKHQRRVHQGIKPPKKHMCDICSKGFRTRLTLASHIRTHTGEKPFACAECGARFTHSSTLHTHVRLVHQKLKRNLARVKGET